MREAELAIGRPDDAADILRRTDITLAQAIASVVGRDPRLEVRAQWREQAPLPHWMAPPLGGEAGVLGRCTGYRIGPLALSFHLAYVDLGRVRPGIASGLQTGRLDLGQVFASEPGIDRFGFQFGTEQGAGELGETLRRRVGERVGRFAWRRYVASLDGQVAFLVVEALPTGTWRAIREGAATGGSSG